MNLVMRKCMNLAETEFETSACSVYVLSYFVCLKYLCTNLAIQLSFRTVIRIQALNNKSLFLTQRFLPVTNMCVIQVVWSDMECTTLCLCH
jgi:hypothetical protein